MLTKFFDFIGVSSSPSWMTLFYRITGTVLLALAPAVAGAEGKKVSLRQAVEMALAGNHLLKASEYALTAAEQGTAVSRSRFLPRIDLEETDSITDMPTRVFMMKLDEGRFSQSDFLVSNLNNPRTTGDFQTLLTLDQPIFDLGIVYEAEKSAREEGVQRSALERRREDVALSAIGAWLEVRRGTAQLAAVEQGVRDAREHRRLAAVREEAGTGLRSDSLRAATFLADMEQQAITAANDLTLARMRLAQVAGGGAGDLLDSDDTLPSLAQPPVMTELAGSALAGRPDLRELAGKVQLAETETKIARSAWYPTLRGIAAFQMNDRNIPFGRDNDGWYAGATLRWELFDGLRRTSGIERARALRSSAAEELEERRREAALQVTAEWLRRLEAEQRLEVAKSSLRDAGETVRLISRRFENSLATMADLLDAQTVLNRARAQVIANENAGILATARLYHSAGLLTKEIMK